MFEDELDAVLDRVQQNLERELMKAAETARAEAPKKTGRLQSSISFEVTRHGDCIQGTLTAAAPYAAHVEYGPEGGFMFRAVRGVSLALCKGGLAVPPR